MNNTYFTELPIWARVFPTLCLTKYSPIFHSTELRYVPDALDSVGYYADKLRGCGGAKSGGDKFAFKVTAIMEGEYSLAAKGLFLVLFSVWCAPDVPLYLSVEYGGYGYIDFRPDDVLRWCGGMKWSKVKRLCGELSDVLKMEKMRGGVWRVVFLLERCDRRLYNDEVARRYGSAVEYLRLHDSFVIREAIRRLKERVETENVLRVGDDCDGDT